MAAVYVMTAVCAALGWYYAARRGWSIGGRMFFALLLGSAAGAVSFAIFVFRTLSRIH